MMYRWTRILPYFIVERLALKINGDVQPVKFGNQKERVCYVNSVYPGVTLVREAEAEKRKRLNRLKRKVEDLEAELEEKE